MNSSKNKPNGRLGANGFAQHAEEVMRNTVGLSTALRTAGEDVRRYLTECTDQKPLATLAVAAAVGYVLGGGPKTRLLSAAFSLGTSIGLRLAVATIAREASQRNTPAAA